VTDAVGTVLEVFPSVPRNL